jgi:thiamine-monophosphate kinase
LSEFDAIELLARELAARGPGVDLGIGDDAALLGRIQGKLVLSVDSAIEHTHFERDWLSPEALGARALHSAASDLAAMGAAAVAVLSALVLPADVGARELRALGKGQASAAKKLGCVVVGGNIARGRDWSVTTTVIGRAEAPIRRRGAESGHELWLIGDVGLAAAGLRLLQMGQARARKKAFKLCLEAWRSPRARVREGRLLQGRASAAIDISDGLAADAGHLARASGKRIVIDERALDRTLAPELREVAEFLRLTELDLALTGGEDYVLLATGPARRRPTFARRIGSVEDGTGVCLLRPSGERIALTGGFDHFAR